MAISSEDIPRRRKVRIDNIGVYLLLKTVLVCDMRRLAGPASCRWGGPFTRRSDCHRWHVGATGRRFPRRPSLLPFNSRYNQSGCGPPISTLGGWDRGIKEETRT